MVNDIYNCTQLYVIVASKITDTVSTRTDAIETECTACLISSTYVFNLHGSNTSRIRSSYCVVCATIQK